MKTRLIAIATVRLTLGDKAALPLFNMGNALQELDRIQEAMQAFLDATKADPTTVDAWINLGRLLDDTGSHQAAVECYDHAVELTPDDPMAWSNRGNSLRSLGQFDDAMDSYNKALKLEPEDFAARLGRGTCLMECDKAKEGLQVLQDVLEESQHPMAMFEVGTALARVDQHDAALTMYDTLIENDFVTPEIWNNRGECLAKLEDVDAAVESFDNAIEFDEEFAPAWFGKARALAVAGRTEEAKPLVKHYLQMVDEEERSHQSVKALVSLCEL